MDDRDDTPTVIPAEPGWWAIHASDTEGERPWHAQRVAAWLVDATRRDGGDPLATATPILGSLGESCLSDCDSVLGIVHENEMTPEVRAALLWLTATALEDTARNHVESLRRWEAAQRAKRATKGAA